MGNNEKRNIDDAVFRISQGNFDLFDEMSREFADVVRKGTEKYGSPPASPAIDVEPKKEKKKQKSAVA
jgi:hypothetical protein